MPLPQATRWAARFTLAVSSTMQGLFPPSSSTTGVRCFAAASMMVRPTSGLPVKKIWSQRTSSSQSFMAPEPGKPHTNSGGNTFARISIRSSLVAFEVREGLSATQLPAAMASTIGTSASCTG